MNRIDLKTPVGYRDDFAQWSAEQAALIRAGKLDRVDLENVAEEIESLGRSEQYQIDSRMEVLLQHLLKWQFQPGVRLLPYECNEPTWEEHLERLRQGNGETG